MKNNSIFERGMHWLVLVFLILKSVYVFYFVYGDFFLKIVMNSEHLYPIPNIIAYFFAKNISLIIFFIGYSLLYIRKFKTSRNLSIIHIVLIISISFNEWMTNDISTFLKVLCYLLFWINVFSREKINLIQEEEDILDAIDFNN